MAIERIGVAGEPGDRGLAIGRTLRERIEKTVSIYAGVFALPEAEVEKRARHFESRIRAYAPDLAEEIDGMAEGAAVQPFWLYALNARSEFMAAELPECTAFYDPRSGVLAQNWDWIEALEELCFVLEVARPDGLRLMTLTEPGIVGKIGMNTAGLGVCLNFLSYPGVLDGVPIHIVLRRMMECASLDDARAEAFRAGAGKAANMLVADAAGSFFDIEYDAEKAVELETGKAPFVHTNHYLGQEVDAGVLTQNTQARYARAKSWLKVQPPVTAADAGRLLGDRDNPSFPICQPYSPYIGQQMGTICAVVMDLPDGSMSVRKGPNPAGAFSRYAFADTALAAE